MTAARAELFGRGTSRPGRCASSGYTWGQEQPRRRDRSGGCRAGAAFKGALTATGAAGRLAAGLQLVATGVEVRVVPVADGGEGTLDALVAARRRAPARATGGRRSPRSSGRRRRSVSCRATPASSSSPKRRDTSGYHAVRARSGADLDLWDRRAGARGAGSRGRADASSDWAAARPTTAAMGLARALGIRFPGCGAGASFPEPGGRPGASGENEIDLSGRDSHLEQPRAAGSPVMSPIRCAGPDGAAHVFGPQKGADAGRGGASGRGVLARFRRRARAARPASMCADIPGAGAAGGAAGGLLALIGGRLTPGAPLVLDATSLDGRLTGAQLCITGEGRAATPSRCPGRQ